MVVSQLVCMWQKELHPDSISTQPVAIWTPYMQNFNIVNNILSIFK
jgi:hypothetical protein